MSEPGDVGQRISDLISEAVGEEGDVVAGIAAHELVTRLRAEEPDVLVAWLDAHAESILRDQIAGLIRSRRARSLRHAAAGAFGRAAKAFEATGDRDVLAPFEQRYVVDQADTRRRVRDMTSSDCLFVAERYELSADRSAMLAAFHRAVARRVGGRTVGEVFSETEYDRMYRSIVKQPPGAVAV